MLADRAAQCAQSMNSVIIRSNARKRRRVRFERGAAVRRSRRYRAQCGSGVQVDAARATSSATSALTRSRRRAPTAPAMTSRQKASRSMRTPSIASRDNRVRRRFLVLFQRRDVTGVTGRSTARPVFDVRRLLQAGLSLIRRHEVGEFTRPRRGFIEDVLGRSHALHPANETRSGILRMPPGDAGAHRRRWPGGARPDVALGGAGRGRATSGSMPSRGSACRRRRRPAGCAGEAAAGADRGQ